MRERQRGIGMTVTVFIVLIMTIFWMLLQFILPGLNDTLCIIFYYLTMCLLGMWCFYYIGVVMAEIREQMDEIFSILINLVNYIMWKRF